MQQFKTIFGAIPLKLYLGFSLIASPVYIVLLGIRLLQGKESLKRWRERCGITNIARPVGRLVWFNAASMGESIALLDLIRAVLDEADDIHVIVTTQSATSAQLLGELLPRRTIHQVAPYDALPAVNRYLSQWRPDVAVWVESELWPRMMHETARLKIPMLLINARVSQRTLARFHSWPVVALGLFKHFDRILVQEETLTHTLQRLGVPSKNLHVVGSLKEDRSPLEASQDQLASLSVRLGERARWLAASTHEGEETALVAAHELAFGRGRDAPLMLIAPRHPKRGPEIMRKLQALGWRVGLRSNGDQPTADTEIYIADTLGEMGLWYRLSPIAFLGGSLAPIGGHNPFEPVKLDCAVIHGAETSNFINIYQRLDQCGGALFANSPDAVAQALLSLQDVQKLRACTQAARDALQTSETATSATLSAIIEQLTLAGDKA